MPVPTISTTEHMNILGLGEPATVTFGQGFIAADVFSTAVFPTVCCPKLNAFMCSGSGVNLEIHVYITYVYGRKNLYGCANNFFRANRQSITKWVIMYLFVLMSHWEELCTGQTEIHWKQIYPNSHMYNYVEQCFAARWNAEILLSLSSIVCSWSPLLGGRHAVLSRPKCF